MTEELNAQDVVEAMELEDGQWVPAKPCPYPPTFGQRLLCLIGRRCWGHNHCDCPRSLHRAVHEAATSKE